LIIVEFVRHVLQKWRKDRASRMAAALAYYSVFSVAPLVVILVAVAGAFLGRESVHDYLSETVRERFGQGAVLTMDQLIVSVSQRSASILASAVSAVVLTFGATRVFAQLKDALDIIWEAAPSSRAGIVQLIKNRFAAFVSVLGAGLLLLILLGIKTAKVASSQLLGGHIPRWQMVWEYTEATASFFLLILVFAIVLKVLPRVRITWRDALPGALSTAVLFMIGRYLFGSYLGSGAFGSIYGAASSFFLILLWFYFLAFIVMLGAECTYVYATRHGSHEQLAEALRSAIKETSG
jgi:membrane protein